MGWLDDLFAQKSSAPAVTPSGAPNGSWDTTTKAADPLGAVRMAVTGNATKDDGANGTLAGIGKIGQGIQQAMPALGGGSPLGGAGQGGQGQGGQGQQKQPPPPPPAPIATFGGQKPGGINAGIAGMMGQGGGSPFVAHGGGSVQPGPSPGAAPTAGRQAQRRPQQIFPTPFTPA
jgi:hypothetical protein